jgi:protein TonB
VTAVQPPTSRVSAGDRMGLTLFAALVVHAILILGIGFNFENPEKQPSPDRTLEILVVRHAQTQEPPKDSDFLAQVSQQGGGQEKERVKPTVQATPQAAVTAPEPAPEQKPAAAPEPPPEQTRELLTQQQPAQRKVRISESRKPIKVRKKKVTADQLLASTSREIDRLTAQLDSKNRARAKWQRHKKLTASTREFKYANYLDAWVRKVERIGNLNYPDEARRRKLYGNLILHVALLPDGSVKEINVKKSSGHKLLDDAAIRIVRLASPFAAFPPGIRKETDILDIIRTWQFRNNNQLSSSK